MFTHLKPDEAAEVLRLVAEDYDRTRYAAFDSTTKNDAKLVYRAADDLKSGNVPYWDDRDFYELLGACRRVAGYFRGEDPHRHAAMLDAIVCLENVADSLNDSEDEATWKDRDLYYGSDSAREAAQVRDEEEI